MNVTTKLLHVITTVDRATEGRLHDALDGTPGRHTLVIGPASPQRPLSRIVGQVEVIEMPKLFAGASLRDEAAVVAQLTKLARRREYAVIHAHSPQAARIARAVARLADIPQVCVSTDLDQRDETRRIDPVVERLMAPITTTFVETDAARKRLEDKGVDPSTIAVVRTSAPISDAVPLDDAGRHALRVDLGIDPEIATVALLGRLDAAHGADIAARVVANAVTDAPVQLLVVGDGPLRSDLTAAGDDRLRVEIVTAPGRALDVIRASDALLAPFSASRVETAQVQAAAAHVPIVTYRAEGVAELFARGASGTMVAMGDVDELTRALSAVLASKASQELLDGAAEGNRGVNVWSKAVVAINYRWRYEPDAMNPIQ